jgi:hypothetical protein
MDKELVQTYLAKEEVQASVNNALDQLRSQNDITKIKQAEKTVVLLNVSNHVINELLDENIDLEEENIILKTENDEYKKRYGTINQEYLSSVNYLSLDKNDSSERNRRRKEKLFQLANKLQKGYKEM